MHAGLQVPVACLEGKLWARISAQWYNCVEDYHALAAAIDTLVKEGGSSSAEQGLGGTAGSGSSMLTNGGCSNGAAG